MGLWQTDDLIVATTDYPSVTAGKLRAYDPAALPFGGGSATARGSITVPDLAGGAHILTQLTPWHGGLYAATGDSLARSFGVDDDLEVVATAAIPGSSPLSGISVNTGGGFTYYDLIAMSSDVQLTQLNTAFAVTTHYRWAYDDPNVPPADYQPYTARRYGDILYWLPSGYIPGNFVLSQPLIGRFSVSGNALLAPLDLSAAITAAGHTADSGPDRYATFTMDGAGNLYIIYEPYDDVTIFVLVVTSDGDLVRLIDTTNTDEIDYIAVSRDASKVYVANASGHLIQLDNSGGGFEGDWTLEDAGGGHLTWGLAVMDPVAAAGTASPAWGTLIA